MPAFLAGLVPDSPAPVLVVVELPGLTVGAGEQQPLTDPVGDHVLTDISSNRVEQVDGPGVEAAYLLAAHQRAVDVALLD